MTNADKMLSNIISWASEHGIEIPDNIRTMMNMSAKNHIVISGVLAEDCTKVDEDEHGIIYKTTYYLGCPILDQHLKWMTGKVIYTSSKDITEILQDRKGHYLRITIEDLTRGEDDNCLNCKDRFKCLTNKIKT